MADSSPAEDAPTVLICDDEPLLVRALSRHLERMGLRCISDTSSQRVLELTRVHHPAIVILDVHQHIDGRDLLSRLKRDPETASTKVLVLSAIEDQYTRQTCLELGAEDYEVKPFDTSFALKVARMAGLYTWH
jgi:CheY-like chemotaxis protein